MNADGLRIFFNGCFFVGVCFIARVLGAPFSLKIKQQMMRHKIIHTVWAFFGVFSAYVLYIGFVEPSKWPPNWMQRRTQCQTVLQRVQEAGGWDAVRFGCDSLVTNYPNGLTWFSFATNKDSVRIPAAVFALKPQAIEFEPLRQVRDPKNDLPLSVVHIWLLGGRLAGGPSRWLGFGLEVPCGPGAQSYTPAGSSGGFGSSSRLGYRKMADRVYEVTW